MALARLWRWVAPRLRAAYCSGNQSGATIGIATINDSVAEGAENLSVVISATQAGAPLIATKASATVTIAASYQAGPGTGTTTGVIAASSDDFEIIGGIGSNDLELGTQNGNPNTVALRFTGLELPGTAEIESAYFVFQAEASNNGVTNLMIEIQNSTSAATVGSAANLNAWAFLPTSVAWNNVEAWKVNQTYQSVDIAPLIEALIGQEGLDPTDALGFKLTGTGLRQAYSFDSNGEMLRLVINFADDNLF